MAKNWGKVIGQSDPTYDAIHDEENYKKVIERFMPMLETVTKDQVYNRFVEISTNGPGT